MVNGGKLDVAIPFRVTTISGPLESNKVVFNDQSFTYMTMKLRLVQDGEVDFFPEEWPFQNVVIIPLHHVDK